MAGKHTRGEFARDFAKRVGAEADTRTHVHTMVALQAWMQAEHGINDESPEARFNPLNTTLEFPGSTLFNELSPGFGVRNYATYDDGLTATARTLNRAADRGEHGYRLVRRLMRNNAPAAKILEAVEASNWGTGGLGLRVLRSTGWKRLIGTEYLHHRLQH